jgi:hypothetical protein
MGNKEYHSTGDLWPNIRIEENGRQTTMWYIQAYVIFIYFCQYVIFWARQFWSLIEFHALFRLLLCIEKSLERNSVSLKQREKRTLFRRRSILTKIFIFYWRVFYPQITKITFRNRNYAWKKCLRNFSLLFCIFDTRGPLCWFSILSTH